MQNPNNNSATNEKKGDVPAPPKVPILPPPALAGLGGVVRHLYLFRISQCYLVGLSLTRRARAVLVAVPHAGQYRQKFRACHFQSVQPKRYGRAEREAPTSHG